MGLRLFQQTRVVDVDTHVTEPPDTWTSRVPRKWVDDVPHIERIKGRDMWVAGGTKLAIPGQSAMAGFDGTLPDHPLTYDDMPRAAWDPKARVEFMDSQGIWAQILYPNVGGFGGSYWISLDDRELALACVRAYNDFQIEFCSVAPGRLLGVTAVPFWDLDATLAEVERCREAGHVGVNFCNQPDALGQPPLFDPHWDPLWSWCQDAEYPVNFHIGSGDFTSWVRNTRGLQFRTNFARASSLMMMNNVMCISDLIFGGVCHRFPGLRLVSVESGVGFMPSILETFDWQWRNGGIVGEHPEYDLLPSEYFRRQIYATFWFERESVAFGVSQLGDNIMFETDFPHPTCQHPGPQTPAVEPFRYADEVLGHLPEDVQDKLLFGTAAKVYGLTVPTPPELVRVA
jgi:predicted TIM-barrel fold metal-dependent hydrolase